MIKPSYTSEDDGHARRHQIFQEIIVPFIEELGEFPDRDTDNWQVDWEDGYNPILDTFAQKDSKRANAANRGRRPANPDEYLDAASARGEDPSARFAQIRADLLLRAYAVYLDLKRGDDATQQNARALCRLLDRYEQLDKVLRDQGDGAEQSYGLDDAAPT